MHKKTHIKIVGNSLMNRVSLDLHGINKNKKTKCNLHVWHEFQDVFNVYDKNINNMKNIFGNGRECM